MGVVGAGARASTARRWAVHFPSAHGPGPAYFPNPQGGGGGGEGVRGWRGWVVCVRGVGCPAARLAAARARAYSPAARGGYQQYTRGWRRRKAAAGGYPYNNAPAHTLMPSAAQGLGESYAFPQAGAGSEYGMPYAHPSSSTSSSSSPYPNSYTNNYASPTQGYTMPSASYPSGPGPAYAWAAPGIGGGGGGGGGGGEGAPAMREWSPFSGFALRPPA